MSEIQPAWKGATANAWPLVYRRAPGGFAIGLVLSLILNLVRGFTFGEVPGGPLNMAVGLAVALACWPQVARVALSNRYQGSRLALVAS